MGSWPFVFLFLGVMALWAAYNQNDGFDPYPFILLNLFLSMIAGLQGAILLISAKRADSVSSEVAVHTLSNTALLQDMIEANTVLTESVAQLAAEIHTHVCPSAHRPGTGTTPPVAVSASAYSQSTAHDGSGPCALARPPLRVADS